MLKKSLSRERQLNIIWTVAENYNCCPEALLASESMKEDAEIVKIYRSIILGGIDRILDCGEVNRFIQRLHYQTDDGELFETIILLCAEELTIPILLKERFGVADIRKKAISSLDRYYFFKNPKNLADEIRKGYYMSKMGKSPSANRKVRLLLDEMKKIDSVKDTESFLRFNEDLFRRFFHFEFSLHESEEGFRSKKRRNLAQKRIGTLEKSVLFDESMEKISDEYTSAEFSSNVTSMDQDIQEAAKEKEVSGSLEDTAERGRTKVESIYGKSSLSQSAVRQMEKKLAVGIHQGQKIHITKGSFSADNKDEYRIGKMETQRKNTTDFFHENLLVYRRNIFRLRDVFFRSLTQEAEISYQKSSAGRLYPSKVWRSTKLSDSEIFGKSGREGGISVAVDILLDASGSQMERQPLIAVQGYLLAQALSLCSIPTRVCSFNNFLDFTVIRVFRDYDDEIGKNQDIFRYAAMGSNRDGLALRIISDSLMRREEEYKILIVLSDGKPNDLRVQSKKSFGKKTKDYTGKAAVDDTAMEVRRARMSGIAVLGVFTGDEEDLDAEKRIFGKDFVYIHRIEQFSDVVGHFLKRQIANITENC